MSERCKECGGRTRTNFPHGKKSRGVTVYIGCKSSCKKKK